MSTVCASDITVTNVNNDNNINDYSLNQIDEIQVTDSGIESANENTKLINLISNPNKSHEKQSLDENKTINLPSSIKSLNEMITNVKNKTIVLDKDYKYSGELDLSTSITLESNLVIDGQGHTVDGAGVAHLFNIADNVTIKNLIIKNTHSRCGGAILWKGMNGIISNCTFINSTADIQGGAILWNGINGIISNCNFQNNTANNNGGSLYLTNKVTISNSTFKNNACNYFGGAIYCIYNTGSVINCTFINCNNSANNKSIHKVLSNIIIENCTYETNIK